MRGIQRPVTRSFDIFFDLRLNKRLSKQWWGWWWAYLNTLRPRQNDRHFTDDNFKFIFLNDSYWIWLEISLKFVPKSPTYNKPALTHWGRVTHICVSKLIIIGSDNGLSPGRRQAIIWTNAGILLIGRLGTNFSEILIEIYTFSFKKMHMNMSSGKWRPFCLGLHVLIQIMEQAKTPYLNQKWPCLVTYS